MRHIESASIERKLNREMKKIIKEILKSEPKGISHSELLKN